MRNLPYRIENHSNGEADMQVLVEIPPAHEMKPGYEPIPDPSWVRVVPNRIKLQAGEEGLVDVILQVPEGKENIGHHYQARILCQTAEAPQTGQTALAFGVSLASRLRFSVGSAGPAEVQRLQKLGIYQMLNFTLEPDSQYVPGEVKPGEKVKLSDRGVRFSLINRATQALDFTVKPVSAPAGMTAPSGYPFGDPSWLKVLKPKIKSPPESIKGVDMELEIPDKPEVRGKRYTFVVQAGLEGREIPVEVFGRIYVTVAGEPAKGDSK